MARKVVLVMAVLLAAAVATAAETGDSNRRGLLGKNEDSKFQSCGAPPACKSSCPPPYAKGSNAAFCKCLHSKGLSPEAILEICLKLSIKIDLSAILEILGLPPVVVTLPTDKTYNSCGAPPSCKSSCPPPYAKGSNAAFCKCLHSKGLSPDAILQICLKLKIKLDLNAILEILGLLPVVGTSPSDKKYGSCGAPPACKSSCPPPYAKGSNAAFCKCLHSKGLSPEAILEICLKLSINIDLNAILEILGLLPVVVTLPSDKTYNSCGAPPSCKSSCPPPYAKGSNAAFCKCLHSKGLSPDAILQICLKLKIKIDLSAILDILGLVNVHLGK